MALNPSNSSNLEQLALKGLMNAWRANNNVYFCLMLCEGSHCEPADNRGPMPIHRSSPGSCRYQGYVRRLPDVQYVRNGAVVRNVTLASFRDTGGYAMSGLRHSDVNNNHNRAALQFNFWRPVTVASVRLVQTRVGFVITSRIIIRPSRSRSARPIVVKLSRGRSVGLCVGLSSALWKNGGCRTRPGMRQVV